MFEVLRFWRPLRISSGVLGSSSLTVSFRGSGVLTAGYFILRVLGLSLSLNLSSKTATAMKKPRNDLCVSSLSVTLLSLCCVIQLNCAHANLLKYRSTAFFFMTDATCQVSNERLFKKNATSATCLHPCHRHTSSSTMPSRHPSTHPCPTHSSWSSPSRSSRLRKPLHDW